MEAGKTFTTLPREWWFYDTSDQLYNDTLGAVVGACFIVGIGGSCSDSTTQTAAIEDTSGVMLEIILHFIPPYNKIYFKL